MKFMSVQLLSHGRSHSWTEKTLTRVLKEAQKEHR
jgi:hypothetical protein